MRRRAPAGDRAESVTLPHDGAQIEQAGIVGRQPGNRFLLQVRQPDSEWPNPEESFDSIAVCHAPTGVRLPLPSPWHTASPAPGLFGSTESAGPVVSAAKKPGSCLTGEDRGIVAWKDISADLGGLCKPVLFDFAFPTLIALIPNSAMAVALYAARGMVGERRK